LAGVRGLHRKSPPPVDGAMEKSNLSLIWSNGPQQHQYGPLDFIWRWMDRARGFGKIIIFLDSNLDNNRLDYVAS
jgi:hypothetical protein